MIDTTSPDYQAGLRAGRRSLRLSISIGSSVVVRNMYLCGGLLDGSTVGLFNFQVHDDLPGFDDFPDDNED